MGAKWSARGIAVVLALTGGLLVPAAARAALAFTDFDLAGTPQEATTMTLSLIGDADPGGFLFVFVVPFSGSCDATAADMRASGWRELSQAPGGDPAGSPSFAQDYPFTVPAAGGVTLCAYLGSTAGVPDDGLEIHFTADPAAFSIDLRDPTPAEQSPWPGDHPDPGWEFVTVAPAAAGPERTAFVLGRDGSQACAPTAAAEQSANGGALLRQIPVYGRQTATAQTRRRWKPYRLCAYLAASGGAQPDAVDTVLITPRRPDGTAVRIHGIQIIENVDLYSRLWASALGPAPAGLYFLVHRGAAACAPTADAEISQNHAVEFTYSTPPGESVRQADGSTKVSFSFSVPDLMVHRACVYASAFRDEPPYGVGTARFVAQPDPTLKARVAAPAPGARLPSGAASFTWDADAHRLPPSPPPGLARLGDLELLSVGDRLALYRANPDRNAHAGLVGRFDADHASRWHRVGFDFRRAGGLGQHTVTVTRPIPPGRYWWRVERSRTLGGRGLHLVRAGASRSRLVQITGAPPLATLSARPTVLSPYVILAVAAAPRTTLQLVVHRGGSVVRRVSAATGRTARTRLAILSSCRQPGVFRYRLRATDAYGNRRTTEGSWRVPPCG